MLHTYWLSNTSRATDARQICALLLLLLLQSLGDEQRIKQGKINLNNIQSSMEQSRMQNSKLKAVAMLLAIAAGEEAYEQENAQASADERGQKRCHCDSCSC
jgi:di/tricarboxylate transporter